MNVINERDVRTGVIEVTVAGTKEEFDYNKALKIAKKYAKERGYAQVAKQGEQTEMKAATGDGYMVRFQFRNLRKIAVEISKQLAKEHGGGRSLNYMKEAWRLAKEREGLDPDPVRKPARTNADIPSDYTKEKSLFLVTYRRKAGIKSRSIMRGNNKESVARNFPPKGKVESIEEIDRIPSGWYVMFKGAKGAGNARLPMDVTGDSEEFEGVIRGYSVKLNLDEMLIANEPKQDR